MKRIEEIRGKTYVMSSYASLTDLYKDMYNDLQWLISRVKELERELLKLGVTDK